jgi:homospermidine synthase
MENDVMQIDTSLETWLGDLPSEESQRTLYHSHKTVRKAMEKFTNGPTCVVTHGANPGYVSHLTKRALLDLANARNIIFKNPSSKEDWAQLMKRVGVKTIHISEQDTQIIKKPKQLNEFINTWSCHGFYNEGVAPSELGWGTHEKIIPNKGYMQGSTVYITEPGIDIMVNSWVPAGGELQGYCIRHSESVTMSEYFTIMDGTYRPSVYYVYQPCKSTNDSIAELKKRKLQLQDSTRIIKSEIISGMDELGVLLLGDDFAWWHGSQMTIETANNLIFGESATSVQIVGSMLAAIVWMIKNPKRGYIEPEDMPFEELLEIGDQYWQPLVSTNSSWKHLCNFDDLLAKKS